MSRPRLGFMMSRFPHLTETFILREIVQLGADGWDIEVYPLILQRQAVMHPEAAALMSRVRRLPYLSFDVVVSNLAEAARQPWRYVTTVARAVAENAASPRFLLRTLLLLPKAVHAARLMRRDRIDHLHVHYATHPAMAAWVIRRLTDIPYSITAHSDDLFVNRAMLATKVRDAAFLVTISDYNRRYLGDRLGAWIVDRVRVIRCGVPAIARRRPAAARAPGARLDILSIGSLQPRKGFDVLMDAAARLRRDGLDFHWTIVGEGPSRAALEQQRAALGLDGVVTLLGAKAEDEVEALLAGAHAYAQPSRWLPSGRGEGLPVALMEAMAACLPVIASSISGIPELVVADETGLLVPPGDAVALAAAVQSLAADPARAARLAAAGRERACRLHDLATNVRALGKAFEDAHADRARDGSTSA